MRIKWERKGKYFEQWAEWKLSANKVNGKWRFALYEEKTLHKVFDSADEAKQWLVNYQTAPESPGRSITS